MSAIDLSKFLNQRAKEMHLSATIIAKKAGISRQTWYRLTNADTKQVRLETLTCLTSILKVSLVELSYLYAKKEKLQQQPLTSTVYINDDHSFISEIVSPFNTMVHQEEIFEKEWKIINSGSTSWVNRRLICVDEEFHVCLKKDNTELDSIHSSMGNLKPQQTSISIPFTASGQHITLSIPFHAPKKCGTVISFWKMVDAQGNDCFPDDMGLSCQVRVLENRVSFVNTHIKAA